MAAVFFAIRYSQIRQFVIHSISGWLATTFLFLAGCSSSEPLVPVTGVITLDGKPIANAAVLFMIDRGGRPATGVTDASGRYQLSTYTDDDGALIGRHEVSVVLNQTDSQGTNTPEGAVSGSGFKVTWIVPEKYSKLETSGLSAEVDREKTRHDFALKSGE